MFERIMKGDEVVNVVCEQRMYATLGGGVKLFRQRRAIEDIFKHKVAL